MAYENAPAEFAERVHKRLLHQDCDKTSRDWHALLQTRHKEHLRIAREFHHARMRGLLRELFQGLLQGLPHGFLSASTMQLCVVDERLPDDSAAAPILRRPLAFPLALMRSAFDKGRDALQGPRRLALPDGSLEKALGDVCDDFSPSNPTRVRIVILGQTSPLVPAVQEQVYWIAREALLNALRHSAASRVEVEIEYWLRKLRVVVRDDGTGIDPNTLRIGRSGHRGLTSMQERAASIGAKVRVSSKRGGGTEVEISLPLLGKTIQAETATPGESD